MGLEVVANKGAGVEILGKAPEECAGTRQVEKSIEYMIAGVDNSNSYLFYQFIAILFPTVIIFSYLNKIVPIVIGFKNSPPSSGPSCC